MVKNEGVVPAIRVRDLRVIRGGRTVIPGLTLDIPRGQVVGLLGPSGCGKTTLMRCVVGVQKIASGDVRVLDLPAGGPELRHRVGYLTQAPSVYGDLTIEENLRYFAAVVGTPRKAVGDEVARVVDLVSLADHAGSRVDTLSGGQRSRVSLAAALVGTPEVLVLDEPTVGLDPVLRRDLWDIFHRLAEGGVTLLISSHVMDEAVRCDHILLMRAGLMLADGTLAEVLGATGAKDAEQAFLTLVDRANAAAAAAGAASAGTPADHVPDPVSSKEATR
ncbi:MAG: ABC transporter ATP-binding protein [Actinomycetales bacterium]|nr:ABC transporter ATP-binding protein [Actinomycetales bacterium]